MKARGVFYYGKFVVIGIAFVALFTYAIMLLWNALVPQLFSGPVLNYWQALGILILSKILFTGLGHGHKDGPPWKEKSWKNSHHRAYWKKRFEEKMNSRAAADEKQEDNSGTVGE